MRSRVRHTGPQLTTIVNKPKFTTLKLVASCLFSLLLGLGIFAFVTAAHPYNPALADGILELEPTSGQVGSIINYTLSGWTPTAYYYIWFDSNSDGTRNIGEPFRNRRLDGSGGDTNTLTVPQVPAGSYHICFDLDRDTTVDASVPFAIIGKLILVPTSGPPGTSVVASDTSNGFAASSSGYIWFDTDDNDVIDGGEPQATVTTRANGTIDTSGSISVPLVIAGTYPVKIDILPDGSVDASASFTVNPAIFLSPDTGVSGTTTAITVTGGGFAADTDGYVWFDTDEEGDMDTDEPQVPLTTTGIGAVPTDITLTAPSLPPNTTKYVLADIPEGSPVEASAGFDIPKTTTYLTVTKYNAYNEILGQETITWEEMRDGSLPVYGDGVTKYYHQGPTFEDSSFDLLWNPAEDDNVDSRDYGAAKGTDVKDLCELVGGASPGDTIKIIASDNFSKTFDYEDVYSPEPEQGRLVVCWYNATYGGYVPAYDTGMRLLFFADDSVNPWHWHAFGNWNMHETLPASRWHFNDGIWPSSSGLSVTWVYNIEIYEPNLVSCDESGSPKDSFDIGDEVYVKGFGLSPGTYNIWIQEEPVLDSPLDDFDRPSGPSHEFGGDPSVTQETVTAEMMDEDGDFPQILIWDSVDVAGKYDVVADKQGTGAGTYDANDDFIDSPGWGGFEVTGVSDYISFTVTTYHPEGIEFNDLNPGETGPADWGEGLGAATVTVHSDTNVDVNVQVKGSEFSGTTGSFPVDNVKYDSDDNPSGAGTLSDSYVTWYAVSDTGGDHVTEVYYWVTIPPGQTAGEYTSTFYYRAIKSE